MFLNRPVFLRRCGIMDEESSGWYRGLNQRNAKTIFSLLDTASPLVQQLTARDRLEQRIRDEVLRVDFKPVEIADFLDHQMNVLKCARRSAGYFSADIVKDLVSSLALTHSVPVRLAYDRVIFSGHAFETRGYALLALEATLGVVGPCATALRVRNKEKRTMVTVTRNESANRVLFDLEQSEGCVVGVSERVLEELYDELDCTRARRGLPPIAQLHEQPEDSKTVWYRSKMFVAPGGVEA